MPRILLIDDDEPWRKRLGELLRRFDYEVCEAENGRSALHQLREQPVDLVITDLVMPEMDGIEMIQTLRKEYPAVKIIAVSGEELGPAGYYLKIARLLGADQVLKKPFKSADLIAAVRKLL